MLTTAIATMAMAVPAFAASHGCDHVHRPVVAHNRVDTLLRNHRPTIRRERVRHYRTCVPTRPAAKRISRRVRKDMGWRHTYANRWPIAFNRLPASDRAWAVSTSSCESGMNPATNTGNGFYGAFQFMLGTWHSAGGTGYPNQHSWAYQAVIAVRWMHVAGAGQWPVCG